MDGVVVDRAGDEGELDLVVEVDEVGGGGEGDDEEGERCPGDDNEEDEDGGVSHGWGMGEGVLISFWASSLFVRICRARSVRG